MITQALSRISGNVLVKQIRGRRQLDASDSESSIRVFVRARKRELRSLIWLN